MTWNVSLMVHSFREAGELMAFVEGEFQVDLYTLPDSLIRSLWDFTIEKLGR